MKFKEFLESWNGGEEDDKDWIYKQAKRALNKHVTVKFYGQRLERGFGPVQNYTEINEPVFKSGNHLNDSVDLYIKSVAGVITEVSKSEICMDFDRSYNVAYMHADDGDEEDSIDDKCIGGYIGLRRIESIHTTSKMSDHLMKELHITEFTKANILKALLTIIKHDGNVPDEEDGNGKGNREALKLIEQLKKEGYDYPEYAAIEKSLKAK